MLVCGRLLLFWFTGLFGLPAFWIVDYAVAATCLGGVLVLWDLHL